MGVARGSVSETGAARPLAGMEYGQAGEIRRVEAPSVRTRVWLDCVNTFVGIDGAIGVDGFSPPLVGASRVVALGGGGL